MKKLLGLFAVASLLTLGVFAADDVSNAIHGTITKLDSTAKTMVIKTKDGTEHTVHFADKTVVWGADKTAAGAKDAFKGLSEGSEVIVHYSEKGGQDTATVVVVKAADGTEHTFDVAGRDTADAAKGIGKAADKTGKVTVYYSEEGGKKVAHFFEKL
jgi:hypothetical protein